MGPPVGQLQHGRDRGLQIGDEARIEDGRLPRGMGRREALERRLDLHAPVSWSTAFISVVTGVSVSSALRNWARRSSPMLWPISAVSALTAAGSLAGLAGWISTRTATTCPGLAACSLGAVAA